MKFWILFIAIKNEQENKIQISFFWYPFSKHFNPVDRKMKGKKIIVKDIFNNV